MVDVVPVFDSEYVEISLMPKAHIVRIVRKPVAGAVDHVWKPVVGALAKLDRATLGILIDMRKGLGRNDDAFEKAFAPYRVRMSSGWKAVALIVASLPGKLQAQRYAREDGVATSIFDDDRLAYAWLKKNLA